MRNFIKGVGRQFKPSNSATRTVCIKAGSKKGNLMVSGLKKDDLTCGQFRSYSVHTKPTSSSQPTADSMLRRELIPVTLNCIKYKYENQIPLTMLTATDFPSSSAIDKTNCDMILVGDSLAMTALGHASTTNVTMDEMIHHARAVKRGSSYAFLIGDMPFGSYLTDDSAVQNAARFIKEADMHAVKLEGGARVASKIKAIVDAGMVVVAHIGLTPQTSNQLGGFRVVGSKSSNEAKQLWNDAKAVKEAGASMVVLECVPKKLAALITKKIGIPVIGIGSGNECSGQVLVYHDILGMYSKFTPKFCKKFLDLNPVITQACEQYVTEVVGGEFPQKSHSFIIKEDVFRDVSEYIENDVKNHALEVAIATNVNIKQTEKDNFSLVNKRVVILGSGSLGSLLASKIQNSNKDYQVRLLPGRNKDVDSIQVEHRIRKEGDSTVNDVSTIKLLTNNELDTEWRGEIDLLVVAVKNYATKEAIDGMMAHLKGLKHIHNIATVQNGFNNEQVIRDSLQAFKVQIPKVIIPVPVYSGVKIIQKLGDKIVIEQSTSSEIKISLPKNIAHTDVGNVFHDAGCSTSYICSTPIPADPSQEIYVDWVKLIVNSTINPVTSIFEVENGAILNNVQMQEMIQQLIEEQVNILRLVPGAVNSLATATELKELTVEQVVFNKVMDVVKNTQSNRCSMCVDVTNNQPTEIMQLNGAFVQLSKLMKLPSHMYAANALMIRLITAKTTTK